VNKYPQVAIICLNWNGWEDTIECLESIFRISYPNYQVVVLDNGSTDDSWEKIKKWAEGKQEIYVDHKNPLYYFSHPPVPKKIHYVEYLIRTSIKEEKPFKNFLGSNIYPLILIKTDNNLGFAGGNNLGMKVAIENMVEYVLLLNNDTIVEPSFLDELVRVALLDDRIAVVGSVIVDYYTQKIVFTNSKIDKKLKAAIRLDHLNSSEDWWKTDRVSGASLLIRVDSLLKYSLFLDEDLFLYCEELDLCLKAKKVGLKIVMAGKSKVYHKESASLGGPLNPIAIYYNIRNRILLAKKLLNFKQKFIFGVLFLLARLLRCFEWIIKRQWVLIKITFIAFKDGIKGKVGERKELTFTAYHRRPRSWL
jgi:GT2 family glycosyltransferase